MKALKPRAAKEETQRLFGLLRRRYHLPEWFYTEQIGLTMDGRIADAIAMNMWASRGRAIHGFEVKATKADLLGELRNPEKAEEIGALCDFWWLVLPRALNNLGIDLPEAWGVLVPRGRGLAVAKHARPVDGPPGPTVPRSLAAALLRRATYAHANDRIALEAEIRAQEFDRGRNSVVGRDERALEECARLHQELRAFEEASGIQISGWEGGRALGEAVRTLRGGRLVQLERVTDQALRQAQALHSVVKEAAEFLHGPENEGRLRK